MDLTPSIEPKSDQLNAEDLLTGPRTFTIEKVSAGNSEQPVNVHLVELPGRPYRPSKSMRRLMVAAWGKEANIYAGRRLTLFRNPEIKFGGIEVGGIEISHMSHLDKPLTVPLMVSKGRRKNFTVKPLAEAAPAPAVDWMAKVQENTGNPDALRALWKEAANAGAPKPVFDAITAAVKAGQPKAEPEPEPPANDDGWATIPDA